MKRLNLRSLWRKVVSAARVGRHVLAVVRAGQLRFRLETFGLYYPALPYSAPWWRVPLRNLVILLGQIRRYSRWIIEMEDIRRSGPQSWWDHHGRRVRSTEPSADE